MSGNSKARYHLNSYKVALINKRIAAIKPISEIPRKPRSLDDMSNFKANEFDAMLLFYLPVILNGIVKPIYLNHFKVLSNSVYCLRQENFCDDQLAKIENDLKKFVVDFENLYGSVHCTMNIHLVKHIAESVRYFGPLWTFSAFPFESFISVLKNFVTGSTDVLHQICSKYIVSSLIHSKKSSSSRV